MTARRGAAASPGGSPGGPLAGRAALRWRGVRTVVALSVAIGMASTAAVVVQALALAALLAGVMPGGRPAHRTEELTWLAAGAAVRGLCALGSEVVGRVGASRAKADLRRRLVGAAVRSATTGPGAAPGSVAVLAGRGLDALDVYIGRCLPDLVLAVAAPLALAAVIGALDWVSGVVVVVALVLFPLFGALVGRAAVVLAADRWHQVEALGRHVTDVFEGLAVVRAFGQSSPQRARIAAMNDALRRASMATLRTAFLSALVLDTLASVSVALVAVPLGLRLLDGSVHLSTALAVLVVAPEVFLPLRRASAEFHDSTEGLAAVARIADLVGEGAETGTAGASGEKVATEPPARPVAGPVPVGVAGPVAVGLHGVRVAYPGREEPVLDDATLVIAPGETVVLAGPNGTGKSTALALLLGFTAPAAGTVVVDGADLRHVDLAAWRRRVTYLPERPSLLDASLAENLRLANPGAGDDELLDALARVGAAGFAAGLPDGLETRLGQGGRPVSAGECQRIALARTLLRPAGLYLLDEPTVHLDPEAERAVVAAIGTALRGRSALVVTHRPALAELADRVVTVRRGRVVAVETSAVLPTLTEAVPA